MPRISCPTIVPVEELLTKKNTSEQNRANRIVPRRREGRYTQERKTQAARGICMCRNIKTLFNFDPPVTDDEVRAASLQFVRKISGFTKPSKANEAAFAAAVEDVAAVSMRLLRALETNAPAKNREEEAARAKARAAERFGA
jgi:hypothetical protein